MAKKQAKLPEPYDPELAAERWTAHITKQIKSIDRLTRNGGVENLVRRWSKERREHFADNFRNVIEQYEAVIGQIKETL